MTWITKIFSTTKAYLYSAIGLLIAGLWVAVKVLAGQNTKLRVENKTQKARNEHMNKVMEADKEIDEQADVHLADAVNEIKETGASDELSDPNEDW